MVQPQLLLDAQSVFTSGIDSIPGFASKRVTGAFLICIQSSLKSIHT